MPNLNVGYVRPNYALQTLTAQLRATYGNPARTYEYVTGYKSAANFSGHNPDSRGIVHAVDIFVGPGNLTEAQGIGVAEQLRVSRDWRASYIIHRARIAGAYNGWQWEPYGGPDGHYDHIHVSVADLYWGDPCPVPASTYDNTSGWAIGGMITVQAVATITPHSTDWFDMATADELRQIVREESGNFWFKNAYGQDVQLWSILSAIDSHINGNNDSTQAKLDQAVALIGGLLQVQLPHPFEDGNFYTVADYLRYGNAFAGRAAQSTKSMTPMDVDELAAKIAEKVPAMSAADVAAQLTVTAKEATQ